MTPLPRIMLAPNGARRTRADHPALPVSLAQVLEETLKARDAGAQALHLHLRDAQGRHLLDAAAYRKALALFDREMPGFAVQITTESVGLYDAAFQRDLLRDLRPPAASVALREITSDGAWDAARTTLREAIQDGCAVQAILYGAEDFDLLHRLSLPQLPQALFVLGRYSADQQSQPADLAPFIARMQADDLTLDWACCAFGRSEIACLKAAHAAGGKMRIGFENAIHRADGTLARDNAERVRDLITELG